MVCLESALVLVEEVEEGSTESLRLSSAVRASEAF